MRILNINSYYYSSSVHRQLQKEIVNTGIDSITYAPLSKGYIPREECQYGTESNVIKSECYNERDRYIFHVKHYKILNDLYKLIKCTDFNCLHAHSLFTNGSIALKVSKKYKIPYVVAVRDTDLNVFFKYMIHLRKLGLKILSHADKIVFLSRPYRDFLLKNYVPENMRNVIQNKSIIIPNGIEEFWLKNKGCAKKLNDKKNIKLLYVGQISKRKNVEITAKAIQLLRNKGYNATLTVVGKIIDTAIFNNIKDLSYVNYISPVSKDKLINVYRQNDIFVMPSKRETFGLVYAEAMSQGLPVIYTYGQGFDGQFEEGKVGYHVNSSDPYDIKNKILQIIDNYESLSKNCIQAVEKFNWTKIAEIYTQIYKNTINL